MDARDRLAFGKKPGFRVRPGARPYFSVESISFTDIVMNLFLFFFIAFNLVYSLSPSTQSKINLKLPSASQTSRPDQVKPLIISLLATGEVYVADTKVAGNQVESVVRAALKNEPDRPVLLRADRDAKLQIVVTLFDSLMKAGATDLNLATLSDVPRPS